jgi:hypothetical protein
MLYSDSNMLAKTKTKIFYNIIWLKVKKTYSEALDRSFSRDKHNLNFERKFIAGFMLLLMILKFKHADKNNTPFHYYPASLKLEKPVIMFKIISNTLLNGKI